MGRDGAIGRPLTRWNDLSATTWTHVRHRWMQRCPRAVWWALWAAQQRTRLGWHARWLRRRATIERAVETAIGMAAHALFLSVRGGDDRPDGETLHRHAMDALDTLIGGLSMRMERPVPWLREAGPIGTERTILGVRSRLWLPNNRLRREHARLVRCLNVLLAAPLLDDLACVAPHDVLLGAQAGGRLLLRSGDVSAEPEAGDTAIASVDCAYLHVNMSSCAPLASRPTWCVVDVQIGSPEDEAEPLHVIVATLWLEAAGHPPTDGAYLARVVDLWRGGERWFVVDAPARDRARRLIKDSNTEFERRWRVGTVQPKSAWPPSGAPHACPRCAFSEVCLPELRRERPSGRHA